MRTLETGMTSNNSNIKRIKGSPIKNSKIKRNEIFDFNQNNDKHDK